MEILGKMMFLPIILVKEVIQLYIMLDDDFWEQVSPTNEPPRPRCRHTAAIYKSNMYIFGGNDNEKSFNDMHYL